MDHRPVFWDAIKPYTEVSPSGYRRPNDGPTNQYVPHYRDNASVTRNNIIGSELRQSLWFTPATGDEAPNVDNTMTGYYADGFFDRHEITDGLGAFWEGGTPAKEGKKSIVFNNTQNMAGIGRVFFNPVEGSDHFNASLFFPVTGYRDPYQKIIYNQGYEGIYQTTRMVEHDTNKRTYNSGLFNFKRDVPPAARGTEMTSIYPIRPVLN
jgi:hypothetical protein